MHTHRIHDSTVILSADLAVDVQRAVCQCQAGTLPLHLCPDRANPSDGEGCGFVLASSLHSHPLRAARHSGALHLQRGGPMREHAQP